jgi:predicted acylesterase/phospholipase RssA
LRAGVERDYPDPGDMCLCLSGGGFRAAAFHLGVVTWLYSSGLLPFIQSVRAVSGGSLVAGWMFKHQGLLFGSPGDRDPEKFERVFAVPLRDFLVGDIRTVPIATTLPVNWCSKRFRYRMLATRVDRLFRQASDPTESCGVKFSLLCFDVRANEPVELAPEPRRLALQVVASAALPPLFGPVAIDDRRLVDGGIASNLGVVGSTVNEWLCVLVSDASRAFPGWTRSRFVPMTIRLVPLLRDGANRAFRSQIGAANSDTTIVSVVALSVRDWYGADSGVERVSSLGRAAKLKTDLAGFSRRRIELVERLGTDAASSHLGSAVDVWAARVRAGEIGLRPSQPGLQELLTERHS